jgi:hypothetical protein
MLGGLSIVIGFQLLCCVTESYQFLSFKFPLPCKNFYVTRTYVWCRITEEKLCR